MLAFAGPAQIAGVLLVVATSALSLAGAAWGASPNDPSFSLQWADSNTGQSIPTQSAEGEEPLGRSEKGTPGADERATEAWNVSTGSRSIVVGVLDSGVQYAHPDLAANIWSNPGGIGGCKAGTHGFNAVDDSCNPEDEDQSYGGHGTHVAGTIGAVGNNGVGVAGLDWQTTILPVKWVQSAGAETDDLADALRWLIAAKEEGVNIRVVNDSLTFVGTLYSAEVKSEIEALGKHNILFVTAAGNSGNNNDEESVRRYPCGYDLANEICVTATNNKDELPRWANYGPHTVDMAAPGVSIYSTLRAGRYGYLSGGSMASAQVAGAAALVLSSEAGLSPTELKSDILHNVRALPALKGKVISGGTLNVCRAMPGCELPPRPSVTTLEASPLSQTSATLRASVNPNGGEVSNCHFDYGTSSSYGESVACSSLPGKGTQPVEVSSAIGALKPNTTYHFRVVASNAGGASAGADATFTTLPEAPRVGAVAVSSTTQTAAAVQAQVDPNGANVSACRFEYGTTTTYGASAQCVPMPGAGSSEVEVSGSLGGLKPHTTYHLRITATNPGGASASGDTVFTTLPNAPHVASEAASAVTQTSATLSAVVYPEGESLGSCQFEYGPTSAYGTTVACASSPASGEGSVAVSSPIGALKPNTTYHFRVLAGNAGGTDQGEDRTLTTLPDPPTVLSEAASSLTRNSAVLNGGVDPNGGGVTGCYFEYGTTASYGQSSACATSPGSGEAIVSVSAAIAGLATNTAYHYRLVAANAGGTTDGADRTFTTLPYAPAVATGEASEVTSDAATLNASVNPNGAEVSDCRFEYGTTSALGTSVGCSSPPGAGSGPVAVQARVTGLSPNTIYHFRVTAANAGGSSEGTAGSFTTNDDPAVLTGAAAMVTQTSALLTGGVNPNGSEVTDCHFEYGGSNSYGKSAPCSAMPGRGINAVEVSAPIGGLTPGISYHFRLVATNSAGTSSGADQTLMTTPSATREERPPAIQVLASTVSALPLAGAGQGPPQRIRLTADVLPVATARLLTVSSSGLVRIGLSCPPGGAGCSGRVVLRVHLAPSRRGAGHPRPRGQRGRGREVTVAASSYTIAAGSASSLRLGVSPAARQLLATEPRLPAVVVISTGSLTQRALSSEVAVTMVAAKTVRSRRANRSANRG